MKDSTRREIRRAVTLLEQAAASLVKLGDAETTWYNNLPAELQLNDDSLCIQELGNLLTAYAIKTEIISSSLEELLNFS